VPSGRGRRSAAAVAAAATASSSAATSAASQSTDFFNAMASLSAMSGVGQMGPSSMYPKLPFPLGLGGALGGPLGLQNSMYAASLGLLPGLGGGKLPNTSTNEEGDASNVDDDDDSDHNNDKQSNKDKSRKPASGGDLGLSAMSSLHPSFPYMFNPMIMNQLYIQSLAAAAAGYGLPTGLPDVSFSGLSNAAGKFEIEGVAPDDDKAIAVQSLIREKPSRSTSSTTVAINEEPEDLSMSNNKPRPSSELTGEDTSGAITGTGAVRRGRRKATNISRKHSLPESACSVNDLPDEFVEDLSVIKPLFDQVPSTSSSGKVVPASFTTPPDAIGNCALSNDEINPPGSDSGKALSSQSSDPVSTFATPFSKLLTAKQDLSDAGVKPKELVVPTRAAVIPSKTSGRRQRSSHIDSIGSKLLAQKQKVESEKEASATEPSATFDNVVSATEVGVVTVGDEKPSEAEILPQSS